MATVAQAQPETGMELERKARPWIEKAGGLQVVDQVSHDQACEELLAVKDLLKEAESHHRPLIDAAHQTHKLALAALAKIADPLKKAEFVYKSRIGEWEQEQARIERQRQREAEEAARKAAEDERLAEASQAHSEGATAEEVDAVLEQPMAVVTPVVEPAFQRTKGISTVETYSAEVTSIVELCRAIVEGKAAPTLVSPNQTALNQMARAMKTTFNIPGVKLRIGSTVRAGGR